jgi:uncharacterized membrane protein YhaH (DUF805 family)
MMRVLHWFISFEGRIGRGPFWLGNGLVALMLFLVERFAVRFGASSAGQIIAFAGAFALYPWSALASQRASDRGRPAHYGMGLVLLILLSALVCRMLPSGAPASLAGLFSGLVWLLALVDLGLMPGASTQPLAERRTNAKPAA